MSLLNMLENKVTACGYKPGTGALASTQHCRKDEGEKKERGISACYYMEKNQGIMPCFGSQPVPARQRTLRKSRKEKREEWFNKCDGGRGGEDKLTETGRNGPRERWWRGRRGAGDG